MSLALLTALMLGCHHPTEPDPRLVALEAHSSSLAARQDALERELLSRPGDEQLESLLAAVEALEAKTEELARENQRLRQRQATDQLSRALEAPCGCAAQPSPYGPVPYGLKGGLDGTAAL